MGRDRSRPNTFRIRPARRDDRRWIQAQVILAGLYPLHLDWRRFLIAIDPAGRRAGCVQARRCPDGSVELASLLVLRPWRGRGLAGRLIRTIQAQAGPPLWLRCRGSLVPFYARYGFERVTDVERMPGSLQRGSRWAARLGIDLAVMLWMGIQSGDE